MSRELTISLHQSCGQDRRCPQNRLCSTISVLNPTAPLKERGLLSSAGHAHVHWEGGELGHRPECIQTHTNILNALISLPRVPGQNRPFRRIRMHARPEWPIVPRERSQRPARAQRMPSERRTPLTSIHSFLGTFTLTIDCCGRWPSPTS